MNSALPGPRFTEDWKNMGFNRFRWNVSSRVVVLFASILVIAYTLQNTELLFVSVLIAGLIIYQVILLIHYIENVNRDLKRFLESIKFSDFSVSFKSTNMGPTFRDLKDAFSRVSSEFARARSENEERFLYFQTMVEHVPVGLISYKSDGEVELINKTALHILNISSLRSLKNLNKTSKDLAEILHSIKPGERALCKINHDGDDLHLAITAAHFILRQQKYTLVSLQNIQSEVERERISREFEIGQEVQKQLLPNYDINRSGFEFASFYAPAKEVGGDYYDFIPIDEERLGIVIGDVSGKGLPAAIYMTFTKGIMQAYIKDGLSPASALKKANSLIYQAFSKDTFVSMIYAVLHLKDKTLSFACAGHTPLLHADRQNIITHNPAGIALGLGDSGVFDTEMTEQKIQLSSGDTLVLFTDGFSEAMNEKLQEFGTEDLIDIVTANKGHSATEIISAVNDSVDSFCGDVPPNDDRTMIVVKVK